jgi:hypothetical protein
MSMGVWFGYGFGVYCSWLAVSLAVSLAFWFGRERTD